MTDHPVEVRGEGTKTRPIIYIVLSKILRRLSWSPGGSKISDRYETLGDEICRFWIFFLMTVI